MRILKQSDEYPLMVFISDAANTSAGKTGLTLTIEASKNGGAFASISPTVTERGYGWYCLDLTSSHTDTLGDFALHITGDGAEPGDVLLVVAANILGDTLPANVTHAGGSAISQTSGILAVDVQMVGANPIGSVSAHAATNFGAFFNNGASASTSGVGQIATTNTRVQTGVPNAAPGAAGGVITLNATNGDDTVAEQLARLDSTVSSAVSAGTVSAFLVDRDHTWKFDAPSQVIAPNVISETVGFEGLLAMDFTEPMPDSASISSITLASVADVTGATEPTIDSSSVSADRKSVHLFVDASAATAGTYTISVKIVTTDSQVIVRKGRLVLQ